MVAVAEGCAGQTEDEDVKRQHRKLVRLCARFVSQGLVVIRCNGLKGQQTCNVGHTTSGAVNRGSGGGSWLKIALVIDKRACRTGAKLS